MQRRTLLILLFCLGLLAVPAARAQDDPPLELDVWIEGKLVGYIYENRYSITGEAGDFLLVEMLPAPGTLDLDPSLSLLNADRNPIAANDDFLGLDAILIEELPQDGAYTLVATRAGGKNGISFGGYILRARIVDLLEPGDEVKAKVFADFRQDRPNYFLLRPDQDVTWAIRYEQAGGDLSARVRLVSYPTGDVLFELSDTGGTRSGVLYTDLKKNRLYVLIVQQGLFVTTDEDESLPVTISVDEAD